MLKGEEPLHRLAAPHAMYLETSSCRRTLPSVFPQMALLILGGAILSSAASFNEPTMRASARSVEVASNWRSRRSRTSTLRRLLQVLASWCLLLFAPRRRDCLPHLR